MGIFTELRKSCRNREAYKATVVKQERIIQDKDRETTRTDGKQTMKSFKEIMTNISQEEKE